MKAQSGIFSQEWTVGVNGGLTLSKISFNPKIPQNQLIQSVGGVTVRYISEKNFGLQAELNYALRGWDEKNDTIYLNRYRRQLAYLELPLMTHLYFDLSKQLRLVFNLGPQIGYNLSEKNLIEPEIFESQHYQTYYEKPRIENRFDYGIVFGGGLELRTGIGSFILDGRYYFGLSDIYKVENKADMQRSSNQVLEFKVTYLAPWGFFHKSR
ncbi:MAG: PorT family protein [Dysgonamonadaceae bacterium]|jgi:hypothetical protein|nr:PorT family protein [Dysgonamonadaceae bacterium]